MIRAEFSDRKPEKGTRCPDLELHHNYEYDPDLHLSGDHVPAYVVQLAGTGKKVLELGAGSGMQTQLLAKDGRNEVVAVDINPASVEKLKRYVQLVYCLDLNDSRWTAALAQEGPFDVVIAADVLEHLYDPWRTMKEIKKLLRQDGILITSLPYAGNSAIMGLLYQDDFAYQEYGLLDKTHIRFFCLHNIETLHENGGFTITDARFVLRPPEATEFRERWLRLPARVRAALSVGRHGDVYQVVTVAQRAETGATALSLIDAAARRCPPKRKSLLSKVAQSLLDL